ncbi:hypothetical protein MVLG_06357 [Microbotryum lychnidis-dioicae p1A1 Lamole]|uniref:Uncharacterized protein n=1 Tax=Microbotryum lychnidis-dioicae (strain p1A1 Lamole / MvSl-1064) TaxID=683840 RepID=U5HH15_USTV1|nr:hypothetical protein MVLG_06357 [Microbotryum lychnidis-dioicae p1A1 Lamole]|eukprot:KDE03134.1 hypothetical protein MVLG_06357 [Microbotryum lychnidis-dioicae p1A1 Lamole]
MHSTERSQSQVRAQKLNDVDSIDSTGPVHATTASSECNVSEPVGLDSVRPTKRATQSSSSEDEQFYDSSSEDEDLPLSQNRTPWERNQRRKFRTETHPQAGWACDAAGNYCEVQTLPPLPHTELYDPTNLYYPFESEFAFEFAKHAQKYRLSESQFNNLIRIHKGVGIDYQYANRDAYRAILDKVPSAKWTTFHEATLKLTAPSLCWPEHLSTLPFLLQSHTFWVLDTAEVLCHLLSSPIFSGHQTYAPQEHFEVCKDGTETQFYSEPHTGTKAWNFQASLDCLRDLGIRINTSHDATALSAGTGTASAHPIYLSLSIHAGFLKREDRGGLVLIGFFPKLTRTDKGNDELWRMYWRGVKHCILEQLWQPIKRYLSGRHLFQFADGHHRFARVYFGPTAVDYPDACWLTGVASGNVVCYDRKHSELHLGPGTPRTSTSSASLRAEARQTVWDALQVDGHELCISDSLHHLIKGMVKDITIDTLLMGFFKDIETNATFETIMTRIAKILNLMPMHALQRRFKDGFQHMNWTGDHTRKLMNVFGAALWDVSWVDDDNHIRSIVDDISVIFAILSQIIMYATSLESTEADLENLEFLYAIYMKLLTETFNREQISSRTGQTKNLGFNWPRLHAIGHYAEWTRKWGVAPHSNTPDGERAHIDNAKVHYRSSNKCNADGQIRAGVTRSEVMQALIDVIKISEHTAATGATDVIKIPVRPRRMVTLPDRAAGQSRRIVNLETLAGAMGQQDLVLLVSPHLRDFVLKLRLEPNLRPFFYIASVHFGVPYRQAAFATYPAKSFYSLKVKDAMYPNPPQATRDSANSLGASELSSSR